MPIVLVQGSDGRPRRFFWLAAGALLMALILVADFNRNLLYLSIVFSVYVVVATTARQPTPIAAGLLFTAFTSTWPPTVPSVQFLSPERGASERTLRDGETLTYRFFVRGVESFADERGHVFATLKVDGRNLANLEVTIDAAELTSRIRLTRKYDYDQVLLSFEIAGNEDLRIVLRTRRGTELSINIGPEVDRRDVFPHAVYVEVGDDSSSLTFHARRPEEAIAAP
jgi:hypothetical protein